MRSHHFIALLAALAVLTLDGVARADLPPPSNYVDPCESAVLDESCQRCGSPEFKSPECHAKARELELVQRCQAWSYTMYCREGGPAEAKPADSPPSAEPVQPPTSAQPPEAVKPPQAQASTPPAASCAVAETGGAWAVGGLLLLVAAPLRRASTANRRR